MNGEVLLSAAIVKDLQGRTPFVMSEYIHSLSFQFLKASFFSLNTIDGFASWKKELLRKQKTEAFIILPAIALEEWQYSGFSNATKQGIYLKSRETESLWTSTWTFNESVKKWVVTYKEYQVTLPETLYRPNSNIEVFKETLKNIAMLAHDMDEFSWEKMFIHAYERLTDSSLTISERLEQAVYKSAVFGGMGSWNDSPPYSAHVHNLSTEYEQLTRQLYEQRKIALMVAINNP